MSISSPSTDCIDVFYEFIVQLVSLILVLIFDVLVFVLTAAKTIRHTIEMRKMRLGKGLGYFILRDGEHSTTSKYIRIRELTGYNR